MADGLILATRVGELLDMMACDAIANGANPGKAVEESGPRDFLDIVRLL